MQRATSLCRLMSLHKTHSTKGRKIISKILLKLGRMIRASKKVAIRDQGGKRSTNWSSIWIARLKHQFIRTQITSHYRSFKRSIDVAVLESSKKTMCSNITQQLERMWKQNQVWVLFSIGNNQRHNQFLLINHLGPTIISHLLSLPLLKYVSKTYLKTKNRCWRCSWRR